MSLLLASGHGQAGFSPWQLVPPLCAGEAWCAETEEGPVAVEALATGCTVLLSHTLVHICKEKAGSGVSQACCHLPSHTHRPQCPTGTHSGSPSHAVPLASWKPGGQRHW